jgi:16S rRNA (adenine1518-N6/adenine1519-N6)-dimethyltransferase
MKLSEMREILAEKGIQLTKSLGQNFLHDANQVRRIVAAAELSTTDKVLEIGPGLGPLTDVLLEEAGEVLAIEKDGRLVELLEKRFRNSPRLRLVHDDALEYLRRENHDWSNWKMVSNLPYSVASPILVELALDSNGPERMVVTLQLEVARRLVAKAGEADYGILTLLVQLDYEPARWFKIPASCFFPPPEVDSACICLTRRAIPLLPREHRELFARVVKLSFSQRRKMMLKLLKVEWPLPQLEALFAGLGLASNVRAETVSLEQFVGLTRGLAADSGS